MTDHKARPELWQADAARWLEAILELRARVEQLEAGLKDEADCNKTCTFNIVDRVKALEAKYETMRLATLEWGEDVDKVKRWSDQHLQRIEKLEGTRRPASKVYEISEPLQLTPEQAQHVAALLAPNSKPSPNSSQIGSSLVERVALAISRCEDSSSWDDEAINWAPEARAAIREVAAWMTSNPDVYFPPALVFAIEQETER
jgi:hypothetical protein